MLCRLLINFETGAWYKQVFIPVGDFWFNDPDRQVPDGFETVCFFPSGEDPKQFIPPDYWEQMAKLGILPGL